MATPARHAFQSTAETLRAIATTVTDGVADEAEALDAVAAFAREGADLATRELTLALALVGARLVEPETGDCYVDYPLDDEVGFRLRPRVVAGAFLGPACPVVSRAEVLATGEARGPASNFDTLADALRAAAAARTFLHRANITARARMTTAQVN